MSDVTGVALIGAGGIGAIRAQAIEASKKLALRVVCDVREDAARDLAARHGATPVANWADAVSRDDVDLVIVSTRPNVHTDIVLGAIAEKKIVLCEKPLAHTVEDAERMYNAAEKAGVRLYTGFNHRYFPAMQRLRAMLDRGELGDVIAINAYAGHPGGEEFGHDWIHDGRITGGGCLVDNGIHIIDLVRFFGGDVNAVSGASGNLAWPFETSEDFGSGIFRTESGAIFRVTASWIDWWRYRFFIEVMGTRGYARASYPPMRFDWSIRPEHGRPLRHTDWFPVFQLVERLRGWQSTVIAAFVREMEDVIAGTGHAATGLDGLRAIQMANGVYRSSKERREVALP